MIFLPIVSRELNVAARRPGTYWVRVLAVLAGLLVAAWRLGELERFGTAASQRGSRLFMPLATLALLYTLVAGARATSDCLSEEKREGTLGLLFLTSLRGYDVVWGKLVARSLNALYGLLAILPLLALPLLFGGVQPVQFWGTAIVLVNTLFLSLAAGVFVSACSQSDRKAMFATLGLMFIFTAGPGLLIMALNEHLRLNVHPEEAYYITMFSPLHPFLQLNLPIYDWPVLSFPASLLITHLLAWLLLLRAGAWLPNFVRERSRLSAWKRWWRRFDRWGTGTVAQQSQFRGRLLDTNPFLWLSVRNPIKLHHAWGLFGAMILGWAIGYLRHGDVMLDANAVIPTVFLFHSLIKIWITTEASHRIAEDRQSGALELLLSTPLSVREILHGQWLALRRQFLYPLLFALGAETLLMSVAGPLRWIGSEQDLRVMLVGMLLVLVLDVVTLGWVGMWTGLASSSHTRAITLSLALVLLLPWAAYWIVVTLLGPHPFFAEWNSVSSRVVIWTTLCLAIDGALVFGYARRRLLREFRSAALFRFAPSTPTTPVASMPSPRGP